MSRMAVYRATLITLNVLFLFEVLPVAASNIEQLVVNHGTIPTGDVAWLEYLYVINSLVVLASSSLALLAVFLSDHRPGRFMLWFDIGIKFLAMVAFGVMVGYRIKDIVSLVPGVSIVNAIALVYASGVMGVCFCLATAIWELKFLLWRKRRHVHSQDKDALLLNY